MKSFYKLVIFLGVFQFAVIIINLTGVFPAGAVLYSDIDTEVIRNASSPTAVIIELFDIGEIPLISPAMRLTGISSELTFPVLVMLFITFGAIIAKATHSLTPMVIAIIGVSFVPMVTNSLTFFNRLFLNWDSMSMLYLTIALGFGILMVAIVTILETPTHGDA